LDDELDDERYAETGDDCPVHVPVEEVRQTPRIIECAPSFQDAGLLSSGQTYHT
jgi:hypothetical protein